MEWFWTGLRNLLRNANPITGLILTGLGLGSALGWWQLEDNQYDSILAFVGALILVISYFLTPTSDPVLAEGTHVRLPKNAGTGIVVKDG